MLVFDHNQRHYPILFNLLKEFYEVITKYYLDLHRKYFIEDYQLVIKLDEIKEKFLEFSELSYPQLITEEEFSVIYMKGEEKDEIYIGNTSTLHVDLNEEENTPEKSG